jgi:hypothetical protein
VVPRTRPPAPGKSGTHDGGATQGRLGGDTSRAGARRSMTARPVPRRHWRSYGNDPLPSGAEARDEPQRALPPAWKRIASLGHWAAKTGASKGCPSMPGPTRCAQIRGSGASGRSGPARRPAGTALDRAVRTRRTAERAFLWLVGWCNRACLHPAAGRGSIQRGQRGPPFGPCIIPMP